MTKIKFNGSTEIEVPNANDFVSNSSLENFKTEQNIRDNEQDSKIDSLQNAIPQITQIRTTVGISNIEDSDIFNKEVVSKADLLWTKQILPIGNLLTVVGEFQVAVNQDTSYKNLFWTTPNGFEIVDINVTTGQFVDIIGYKPLTTSSLNALQSVNGVVGWSNFGAIPTGYYQLSKILRASL